MVRIFTNNDYSFARKEAEPTISGKKDPKEEYKEMHSKNSNIDWDDITLHESIRKDSTGSQDK